MRTVDTRFKYIIRTQGKHIGQSDNIRNLNCDGWSSLQYRLIQELAKDHHKVEVLAVLETWIKD